MKPVPQKHNLILSILCFLFGMVILVYIFFGFGCALANAKDIEIRLKAIYQMPTEKLEPGIEKGIEVGLKEFPIYTWLSESERMLRFGGQETADLQSIGIGLGIQKAFLKKRFLPFFELGYFMPNLTYKQSAQEGFWIETNKRFFPSYKNGWGSYTYQYEVKNAFGVYLGFDLVLYKVDWMRIKFTSGYRYLKYPDVLSAYHNDIGALGLEHYGTLNASTFNFGIKLEF